MSDWKDTLRELAPTVAGALGGPFAMTAVNIVAGLLGVEADEKKIGDMVASGDPEVLLKLRTAEQQFNRDLKRLEVEREQLQHANTDSARELGKSRGLKAQYALSSVFIAGYFVVFAGFIWALVEQTQIDQSFALLFATLLGVMTKAVADILNFWFGGSAGLKDSNEALERLVENAARKAE